MPLVDSLDRWTISARQILRIWSDRGIGSHLPITLSELGRLWELPLWGEDDIDEAFDDSNEALSELHGYLSSSPNDVAVRWTVLAFLHDLRQEPADDDEVDEWYPARGTDEDRERFREELAALVSLPDIAGLTDPERVRWEIQNSCLVSDFGRAEKLFLRLQEIEPSNAGVNCARLGEFHLLRALHAEPDDIGNAAIRLTPPSTEMARTLARWGVAVDTATPSEDEAGLNEARHWFEKAVKGGAGLPEHHASVLARCFFIEQNYRRAAALFQDILARGGMALEGEQAAFNDEMDGALHLAVARSHELAGDAPRARAVLEKYLEKAPHYGPGFRRLAELSIAVDADYRGAYEVLVRWSDAEPNLESDIWVRTLLGFGGIKDGQSLDRMLDEFFDAHPKRLQWVKSAVRSHWPAFDSLSDKAQRQWLYGCWILWWRPPGFEALDYAAAATYFSRTLEIELRERVFAGFVESLDDLTALKADLRRPRPNARGKSAWGRLLDGKGGLGDMLIECDPSRASDLRAAGMLKEWLKPRFPTLLSRYDKKEITRLNSFRTTSTHTGEEMRTHAEELCTLSRRYIEYLLWPGA